MRNGRRRCGVSLGWMATVPVVLAACARDDPPAPRASASVALPDFASDARPPASAAPSTETPTPVEGPDADSAALSQTRDRPRAEGPAFEARVNALWSGIVEDDPQRAMIFFFPLAAYQQVKDVANPTADWKHRLVAAFARDIHALHGRLPPGCVAGSTASREATGRAAGHADAGGSRCRFVNVEVLSGNVATQAAPNLPRWVEPGEEYNKIGYYRAFGSRLRYEVDGAARSFDVKSLISWRGEWYVVHLSAI